MNATTIMKVAILAAAVGLLGQAETFAGLYGTTVLGDGATHYWRLGEDTGTTAVNRANPGTNDGTYTGGYTLGEDGALFGSANTAVRVDGSSGYVAAGNLGARPTQGTIEFWMNADVLASYPNVFSTSGAAGVNEGFRFEERSDGRFGVYVGPDGGATYGSYAFTSSLTATQWHHVALTWNDTTGRIKGYLNGSNAFDAASPALVTSLPAVEIGRGFSTARAWDGLVDEVAIYNTALDDQDVQLHYDIGTGVVRDDVISANFATGKSGVAFPMTADMIAGVVPVKNWNNLTGQSNSTGVTLDDATGTATTASIVWSCNGTWETGINPALDGDHMMMKAHLDARVTGDATITVSGLPDSITALGYDVLVYFDASTDTGLVYSGYTIGDQTYWTNDTSTFSGTYVQAIGTTKATATLGSNYARFTDLTGSSFTLIADSDLFRAEVSGIQIIANIPEPSTLLLAGIGLLALLARRRRRQ